MANNNPPLAKKWSRRELKNLREMMIMRDARERLKMIAEIIEQVDNRCMAADGSVTATNEEITLREIKLIYGLAIWGRGNPKPQENEEGQ